MIVRTGSTYYELVITGALNNYLYSRESVTVSVVSVLPQDIGPECRSFMILLLP